jgi:hypothetical protein
MELSSSQSGNHNWKISASNDPIYGLHVRTNSLGEDQYRYEEYGAKRLFDWQLGPFTQDLTQNV